MFTLDDIKRDKTLLQKAVEQITPEILGSVIDHTQLNPVARHEDIKRLCAEADDIGSFVCINGDRVHDVRSTIRHRNLRNIRGIAAVADFPFGASATTAKADAVLGVLCYTDEADTVINVGKLLEGRTSDYDYVERSIEYVSQQVWTVFGDTRKVLKVIQENCALPERLIADTAEMTASVAERSNVHMFAKTSTGFGVPKDADTPKGATLKDVLAMYRAVVPYQKRGVRIGIKAAGDVGDAETAVRMMMAGGCFDDRLVIRENLPDIFRIGASAGKTIVDDFPELKERTLA